MTPKEQLEIIKKKNNSWKSNFAFTMEVWEVIAENINGAKYAKERKFWIEVMDLFHSQKDSKGNLTR